MEINKEYYIRRYKEKRNNYGGSAIVFPPIRHYDISDEVYIKNCKEYKRMNKVLTNILKTEGIVVMNVVRYIYIQNTLPKHKIVKIVEADYAADIIYLELI